MIGGRLVEQLRAQLADARAEVADLRREIHDLRDANDVLRVERDEALAERDALIAHATVHYADGRVPARLPLPQAIAQAKAATSNGVHARVVSDGAIVWDSLRDGGSAPGRVPILVMTFLDAD